MWNIVILIKSSCRKESFSFFVFTTSVCYSADQQQVIIVAKFGVICLDASYSCQFEYQDKAIRHKQHALDL